jgi:3-oxoacyl-(acyl-carrier-protein) synthase/phosphopantetheinyl transferase (holo-ACP synthase)
VRTAFTERLGPEQPESAIGLVPNLAASRVANRLDLRGPAYTVDAACASSLVAVDHAVRELADERCDLMLAGGVHHCHDITLWSVFSQLGALSRSERIRPLHRDADGVLIGEGTGVVVLKRLADAERDGDRVYAVIAGTGVASDGRSASLFNPDPGGQARAVRQAWDAAGLDPRAEDAIGLLEAHGTATPAGDTAELTTVADVFGPVQGERAVIGSVKSMIGHTMPAAGIAGLIKTALALHHRMLPPTLHCDEPNPALITTRFETLAEAKPWPEDLPHRAGVNAFGFGGINAHVVLERPATAGPAVVTEPERVLRLAAATPGMLAELLDADDATVLDRGLDERERFADPVRLGIVDPTPRKLALARKAVAKGKPWRGRGDVWFTPAPVLGPRNGRVAFVFPGLEAEFEPRAASLARRFGLEWTDSDPAIGDIGRHGEGVFRLGRLLDTVLRRLAIAPDAVAGHSMGEWTAMAAGGIHSAEEVDAFLAGFDPDALRVPGVVFAVLGAAAGRVLDELTGRTDVVLSHDNAPNQSMICGPRDAVEEIVVRLRACGVIGQILPFRSGFHTPLLAPYLDPIRAAAERYTLHQPTVPVWSATTAAPYPADPQQVRELFVRHLVEPVRFRQLILAMHDAGFRAFVQLGAGQLGSLIDDTLSGREHLTVPAHNPSRDCLAQVHRVVTALWVDGAAPDAAPLLPAGAPVRSGRGVRLDLGGGLISLPDKERLTITQEQASPLDRAASGSALAAELKALLRETATAAAEVMDARRPAVPAALRIDVKAMPYLLDHCFFRQRPDWPEHADRWPIVPATTVITHLMAFAEQAVPGMRAVEVLDVRLLKWIEAMPSVDVPLTVEKVAADRVEVGLTGHARALIRLAPGYGAPPRPWTFDPATERKPEHTAAQVYDERWLFHGPLFQGMHELTAIGENHVRGTLISLAVPGALLDTVGQLLGYWIMSSRTERTTVFPVRMDRLRFHGPQPPANAHVECLIKITGLTATALTADMQIVHNGQVWAELTGWADRRFDSDPGIRKVDRHPGTHTLSTRQDEGWSLVHERWPDLATRDLIMRNILGGAERATYLSLPPVRRRQWLLGRVAAKDAVRELLWADAPGEIYPAELLVANDDTGRPLVRGVHGRQVGELTVSIAHRGEAGVAIARRGPCGIDIEEVTERSRATVETACEPAERELLDGLAGSATLWFTRFWVAKEAVAKLLGTGLRGKPMDYRVIAATENELRVRHGEREFVVAVRQVGNPPGLPERAYVVAWTTTGEADQS